MLRSGKAADCCGLVVMHLENGVELGYLQQVLDAFVQAQQLELAAMVGDGGEAGYQLTDSRAVDICNITQIQEYLLVAAGREVAHGVAERARPFSKSDSSAGIDYGHVTY